MDALTRIESSISLVPWLVVSFFLKRTLNQIEKRIRGTEVREEELGKLLNRLNTRLEVLNWTVNSVEAGTISAKDSFDGALSKQEKKIEKLTTQVSMIVNRLTAIRAKLEASGQRISKADWQGGDS